MIIDDYILIGSKNTPNFELIRYKNKGITYKKFNHIINSYVKELNSLDPKILRILIDIANPIFMLGAMCACNRAHKIPAIMPSSKYQIKNINYMELSQSEFLLNNNCIIQSNIGSADSISYNNNDVQCVIFSSGTEDKPKAIELTFENIYSSSRSWNSIMNFKKNNTYINILPLHHISGLSIFFRSIFFNMVQIINNYNEGNISQLLEHNKINFISIVPKIITDAMSSENLLLLLQKIDTIIIGGDKITSLMFEFCKTNKINAFVSYGMSETSSGISGYFIKDTENYIDGYIGDAFKDNKITIDKNKISIISKAVMRGYVDSYLCNNQFNSSDIGCKKNGKFIFQSRSSNIITSGGENINLKTISSLIIEKLSYNELHVVGHRDHTWGEILVLVYKTNPKITIDEIVELCENSLPKYMVPKHYMSMDKIPYKGKGINKELIAYYINESLK